MRFSAPSATWRGRTERRISMAEAFDYSDEFCVQTNFESLVRFLEAFWGLGEGGWTSLVANILEGIRSKVACRSAKILMVSM